jgi:hypothetical protein
VHVQGQHGNGKRWLLIGALILGVFWIINDSYHDGYTDALIETGQVTNVRRFDRGPHFPWGLLIVGGIAYVAWRKGAFDRFGGPGSPFGGNGNGNGSAFGSRGMQRYGADGGPSAPAEPGPGANQGVGVGPLFRGPRGFFEEWHRQAHASAAAWHAAPPAPPAAPRPPAPPAENGGTPGAGYAPAPSAPAPEYWAAMARESGAAGRETPGAIGHDAGPTSQSPVGNV